MSQFPPRFKLGSPPSTSSDPNVRLRIVPEDHDHPYQGRSNQFQDKRDSVYSDQMQATQTIKKLSFWSNADQEKEEENDWNERQSPSTFILTLVILVVASTLVWFLFRWLSGEQPGTPPLIPADTAPFKVRPENPGGMMIPHQDKLVYGRLSPNAPQQVERLLPPPEQLMAEPSYPPSQPPHYEGQYSGHYPPRQPYGEQPYGAPPVQQQPPYPPQAQGYPNPSQEVGYAPHPGIQASPLQMRQPPYPQTGNAPGSDPTQMMHSAPPQPYGNPQAQQYPYQQPQPPLHQGQPYPVPYGGTIADSASQETYRSGVRPQKKGDSILGNSTIESIKPASEEDEDGEMLPQEGQLELDALIAKEAFNPVPKSSKRVMDNAFKPTPLDPSKYKIQIASLPSRAMAEQEMKRLKANHGQLFGSRPWNIQKIDLGAGRGVTYRLVVGSFSNKGKAVKFSSQLRAQSIGGMVIAPVGQ